MQLDTAALDAALRTKTEPEPFSGVVYLTRGDEVLFQGAYGLALRSEQIANHIDTRFQIASGCKAFTAVAVLQLVERGLLSLDTPLLDVIGDLAPFPHYAANLSVRHLLTHSSGITSYFEEDVNDDYEALWQDLPMYRMREPRDFLSMFSTKPVKFAPGERFEYNDGGFVLLGAVVAAVSGTSFEAYVTQNVFAAADMADSGYFAADQLPARTARHYIHNEDGSWRTNAFAVPIIGGGDGGAYTTAPDMARFWHALHQGNLLSDDLTERMLTPQIAAGDWAAASHYGLGVWLDQRNSSTHRTSVEGADPGVAMRSAVYGNADLPWDERLVLTMLGNTGSALWPMWQEVASMLSI